jgi:isopentenyldiphosphate isomerase
MHSTDDELLEVVDSEDTVIRRATRAEIHRNGLMHRAVHLFVFNASREIYVQRRSASKDSHPLKLDSSAAGHVDPGESYEEAAVRELREELGITGKVERVLRLRASPETDYEHVTLFCVVTESEPSPNSEEIVWGGFMTRDRLSSLMEQTPEDFVPAFILLWKQFVRRGL